MYSLNTATGNVTRDSDGAVVAPAQSVEDPLFVQYNEWVALGNAPVVYTPPVTPPSDTRITVLAFRNRFTQTEKVTIELSSIDNPEAPMAQRQLAASLRVMNTDLLAASFIDLANEVTIGGLQALEMYGIIPPGRASEILTAPIQPHEIMSKD